MKSAECDNDDFECEPYSCVISNDIRYYCSAHGTKAGDMPCISFKT